MVSILVVRFAFLISFIAKRIVGSIRDVQLELWQHRLKR